MSEKKSSLGETVNFVAGAIVGATVGALAGLLFAPSSGKDTRDKILSKSEALGQKAKELDKSKLRPMIDNLKSTVESKVKKTKKDLMKAIHETKTKLKKMDAEK